MRSPLIDSVFDDAGGRTRFAWTRTLLVTFVVSLFVERLFFSGSPWSLVVLAIPGTTVAVVTLIRSRELRNDPGDFGRVVPAAVLSSVLFVATAALVGVLSS